VFRGAEIRKEYKEFLSRSLSLAGAKRRKWVQVGSVVTVALVYVLALFDFYPHLYELSPTSVRQFAFDLYPVLKKIDTQMASRGDWTLFQKYFVFSQLNFLVLGLTFVAAFFSFQGKRDRESEFGLGGYFVIVLGFISLVLLVVFANNDAGYGTGGKILVYPKLGLGEFFFIRDSFFIAGSAWIVVDLAFMLRLMMQPGRRKSHLRR